MRTAVILAVVVSEVLICRGLVRPFVERHRSVLERGTRAVSAWSPFWRHPVITTNADGSITIWDNGVSTTQWSDGTPVLR